MCQHCNENRIDRREVLKFGAAGLLAIGTGTASGRALAAEAPAARASSPKEALALLEEGNARYAANPEVCAIDLAAQRQAVATGQAPWATIIGCADSRVPPELIFGGTVSAGCPSGATPVTGRHRASARIG